VQDALVRMEFATPDSIELKGYHGWGDVDQTGIAFTPYHYATGSGDVAPLVLPNWEGILDIKTMHGQAFDRLLKTGLLPERFAAKYEAQINIYMDFFDQPAGMILAVNKGSSQFAEVVFDRNQDLIDTIYAKWQHVSDMLDFVSMGGELTDDDFNEEFPLPLQGPVCH